MTKKLLLPMFLSLALLCGCSQASTTWQEQYDLGVKYLSQGNYEEAILAFEAAIRIDPRRAETYAEAARASMALGDSDRAADFLTRGQEAAGDAQALADVWAELGLTPPSGGADRPGESDLPVNDLSFADMTVEEITAALPSLVQPEPAMQQSSEDMDGSGGWVESAFDANDTMIWLVGYNPDGSERQRMDIYVDREQATLQVNRFSTYGIYPGGLQYLVQTPRTVLVYQDSEPGTGKLSRSLTTYTYSGAQVTMTVRETTEDFDCSGTVDYTMASPDNEIQLWTSRTDDAGSSYDVLVIRESGPDLPEGRCSAFHGDGSPYPEFDLSPYTS